MPDTKRITHLFDLYTQNKASEAETLELFELLKHLPVGEQLDSSFSDLWHKVAVEKTINEPDLPANNRNERVSRQSN